MKYRKKPVVIEAFKFGFDVLPDWFVDKLIHGKITLKSYAPEDVHPDQRGDFKKWCEIETLEGTMRGDWGDYIILGVKGECYPCKPDIFEMTYEPVKESGFQVSDIDNALKLEQELVQEFKLFREQSKLGDA